MASGEVHMNIAILVYPGVTALDVVGPYEVLNRIEGVDLRFVWKAPGPVLTDSGILALGATHGFDEVSSPDVLIVPGSAAETPTMMADGEVIAWIRTAHEGARLTASVCSGALILGAAGILEGLPATTHWAGMSALARFGAEPRPNERVVRAGKVMTAAGVSAGIDMALVLAAELFGEQTAKVEQLYIEYAPRPPFTAGHMSTADPDTIERARALARERARNPRNVVSIPKVLARRWIRRLVNRPSR
jgi:transcriptional regulator GlxA family with amidase domain